jgi:predicted O-methyltransferase YrrM
MIDLLDEILRTRRVFTAGGEAVKLHSSIGRQSGQFLQKIVADIQARETLEVGLGYGISALFVCDALQLNGGRRHVAIDPFQSSQWLGIGRRNLQQAGFDDLLEFHERPSYQVLSGLQQQGRSIDFALIDGFTTFDYKLVDAFLVDKLLNVGGIMVIRTGKMIPARKVCAFIESNWPYSKSAVCAEAEGTSHGDELIAFRKTGHDERSWKHHADF